MTKTVPVLRFDETPREKNYFVLKFGRHKGRTLCTAPTDYVRFLANPGENYKIPQDVQNAAKELLDNNGELGEYLLSGQTGVTDETIYVIEREGDLEDITVHKSRDAAIEFLALEYPIEEQEDFGGDKHIARSTPDPEDDRILIWEVLASGHKKVVGHFSGWHWDSEKFGIEQITLPGDEDTLYSLAMRNY